MTETSARLTAPLAPRFAYPLAAMGGLLYALGYPGIDAWPAAFVAQALLVVAIHRQPARRAGGLGFAFGLALALVGFYWVDETVATFAGFPWPARVVILVALCAYQGGGRVAAMTWLARRADERGLPLYFAYLAAFAGVELAYPLLFPYYASASLHRLLPLVQIADVGGPIGVGLVLALANVSLAELAIARLERRAPKRGWLVAGVAALAGTAAYGVVRIRMVDARVAAAPRATVGIVQANLGPKEKRLYASEAVRRHRDATLALVADRAARGLAPVDFVVWSEGAIIYDVPESRAEAFVSTRVLDGLKAPLVFGAGTFRDDAAHGGAHPEIFNTAYATSADGRITGRYDKHRLLAFGETLPFADELPFLRRWSPESGQFSAGVSLEPLRIVSPDGREHRASMLICYEDILHRFVRDAVRAASPELLLNVTNDAWFGDTTEPWEHYALAKLRAVEHRRFLVRSTNSGVSAIVDPVGRSPVESHTFRAETLVGEIRWLEGRTVYEVVGDAPFAILGTVVVAGAFRRRKSPRDHDRTMNS